MWTNYVNSLAHVWHGCSELILAFFIVIGLSIVLGLADYLLGEHLEHYKENDDEDKN